MNNIIRLTSTDLNHCPLSWQRFINYVNPHGRLGIEEIVPILLNEWNATLVTNEDKSDITEIVFATESERLAFEIAWL